MGGNEHHHMSYCVYLLLYFSNIAIGVLQCIITLIVIVCGDMRVLTWIFEG